MSKNVGKSNGKPESDAKGKHHPHPHPHPHARADAGDEDSGSEGSQDAPEMEPLPENILKRVNCLKHLHMDIQKLEQDMQVKVFHLEGEYYKKMESLLKKRAEVVAGKYEPSATEAKFAIKEDAEEQKFLPDDKAIGIPKFWLQVLSNCVHTVDLIEEQDAEVLEFLTDVRVVYTDSPLGFTLEFEFKENPFFTNTVLTRSYQYDTELSRENLYMNTNLTPKTTQGCTINWNPGKNTGKKITKTSQRNKKTGERREVKAEKVVDTFFDFFNPSVTDLESLMKATTPEGEEHDLTDTVEKAQKAELEYEVASLIRTRMIPRALVIFTGEDDEDMAYSDEEDYEDGDEDDDEEEEADEEPESDSDDDADQAMKGDAGSKKPAAKGKQGKGPGQAPRRS